MLYTMYGVVCLFSLLQHHSCFIKIKYNKYNEKQKNLNITKFYIR